ncbi:MAG: helix-turn-helix domain-containing protein [Oscillospiraceae bacterium]|jgi:transcriptional regulator with XRE-family HTH domain
MNEKKTFGAFILQRRRALNMTQKEFAEKLYVTESAVSKWERGLSYPDITLLTTICDILHVSEHELLTGNEDTERRVSQQLAARYMQMTRRFRLIQYILYGLILVGCAIGNLVAQHRLDWFFIVFASVLTAASLTLVPALAALRTSLSRKKAALTCGSFTLSLELLLLVCCVYTGGDWFLVAAVSVLFGLSLVFLPFLLPILPLPASIVQRKTSVYLAIQIMLLLMLLLVCCLYTSGGWFPVAAVSVLFGLGFLILPVWLRQLPLPGTLSRHKILIYFTIQTVLLLVLLAVVDIAAFVPLSLPLTLLCAILPWGIMLILRYLPVNGWFRWAGVSSYLALWIWLAPAGLDKLLTRYYGYSSDNPYSIWISFDFSNWSWEQTPMNVIAILLFALIAVAIGLFIMGLLRCRRRTT